MLDSHEWEAKAPLGLARYQLTEHLVSSIEEKRGTTQAPRFIDKKRLRDDDHKDEPTLDRTLPRTGRSREVGLARRPKARS